MKTLVSLINLKKKQGFTLIELLVVIGILAVLLAITLIAINPTRQFAQANNTARRSDANAILNAISQYIADNRGQLPPGLSTAAAGEAIDIDSTADAAEAVTGEAFCNALVPQYIAALPADPVSGEFTSCADYDTGYQASRSAAGTGQTSRVSVMAPGAELGAVIQVTR